MQNILSFGQSIRQFKNESGRPVFQQAQNYPAFFDRHLLHPSRRIKVLLNDPNANIKAFYLQYLMLCFEIENPNYEFYITKIQKFLLDPNFNFLFLEQDDDKIFNDRQFKRFMLEFMEILDSGQFQSTQAALNTYPIADIVFIYFFRSLAIYANITNDYDSYIDKTIIFGFLLENFNIDAQMYQQKCIKFIQAEVFVFQQSPQQIYIVYKDTQTTLTSSKVSSQLHNNSVSMTSSKKQDNQQVQQNISMLQQEQQNIGQNNQNNTEAFRKKMIQNNNNNIARFKTQLEQQPSVLSRNDDQIDSQMQLQESFKKSQLQVFKNNQIQGLKKGQIQGFKNNQIQGFKNNQIQGFKNNQIQGFKNNQIQGFKKGQIQGLNKIHTNLVNQFQQVPTYIFNHKHKKTQSQNRIKQQSQSQIIHKKQKQQKQQEQITNKIQKSLSQGQKSLLSTQKYKFTPQTTCTNDYQYNMSINQHILKQDNKNYYLQKSHSQIYHLDQKKYSSMNYNKYDYNLYSNHTYHNQYGINNRQRSSISQTDSTNKLSLPNIPNSNMNNDFYSNNNKSITNCNMNNGFDSNNNKSITNSNMNNGFDSNNKKQITSNTDILAKITEINSRFNNSIKNNSDILSHNTIPKDNTNSQYKSNYSNSITNSPIKQIIKSQSYNYFNNLNQFSSNTHIPPTRDVPIFNYHQPTSKRSIYQEDCPTQYNHGFNSFKQTRQYNVYGGAVRQKNINNFDNKQVKTTNQYQSYIYQTERSNPQTNQYYNTSNIYNMPIQKTTDVSIQRKQSYIPYLSHAGTSKQRIKNEIGYRDLREQSLTNKDKWRQQIMGKLSVSKQFTDSLTLVKMGQPYNSNIKKMKTRSRQFRQSIINSLK